MSMIDKLAEKVANKVQEDSNEAFDPAMIGVFAKIILDIVEALQKCKESNEVASVASSPSVFERLLLRRTVIDNVGRKTFRQRGAQIIASMLDEGSKLSDNEAQELYDEVG